MQIFRAVRRVIHGVTDCAREEVRPVPGVGPFVATVTATAVAHVPAPAPERAREGLRLRV